MAPTSTTQVLLSPAELSYLHTSLSLTPPIRPDARTATQFRPLVAECDILAGTNGSARVCFADGTEAVVGVKAEVEKTASKRSGGGLDLGKEAVEEEDEDADDRADEGNSSGDNAWVEVTVEIPGFRDDDSMPVFLAAMLSEALVADGEFVGRLWINRRFHWKIYIDVLLLSPPLSYPLQLLSLTTHLALLSTRLPKLKSEKDEDPLFDDDWDASEFLYPRTTSVSKASKPFSRPPITLLVAAVAENIIFDPSKEELAVAETVLAVSVGDKYTPSSSPSDPELMDVDSKKSTTTKPPRNLTLLSVRTIDPPSRLTPPGVPNFLNTATGGTAVAGEQGMDVLREGGEMEGVWQIRRGGAKRTVVREMVRRVLESGGVAEEVLEGLEGVDLG